MNHVKNVKDVKNMKNMKSMKNMKTNLRQRITDQTHSFGTLGRLPCGGRVSGKIFCMHKAPSVDFSAGGPAAGCQDGR